MILPIVAYGDPVLKKKAKVLLMTKQGERVGYDKSEETGCVNAANRPFLSHVVLIGTTSLNELVAVLHWVD